MKRTPVILKTFDLGKSEFPQVLLLGNGLCVSAGKDKNETLIEKISKEYDCSRDKKALEALTFPMKIAAISGDHVNDVCEKLCEHMSSPSYYANENLDIFRQYLILPMDSFLTTNYSYELELSLRCDFLANRKRFLAISKGSAREMRYFLHTFYQMYVNESKKNIWHIHGEAALKDSITLGFYYYGNLLSHYKTEMDKYSTLWSNQDDFILKPKSWLDHFIFGDIYIVGFKYDLAESDC